MSRYANLRESISYFAATPQEQLAHDWGADEAVNDQPYPLEDMLYCNEITQGEVDIIRPFEDMVLRYCSRDGLKPWNDEAALFHDSDWAEIRRVANNILKRLR
jgi:hypothetical protein